MRKIILIISIFSFVQCGLTQTTGSFQQNITFEESDYNYTRTLYYYVPSDYDENTPYKLVVGFRGGPHTNAGQFRNQLSFLADSINAIILCPENEEHFLNNEGLTKQLFNYSVASAMTQYNIDLDRIYLTGLSYGGRHAVIVSMDTDDGPIPNIRGVIPFAAGSDSHLMPNYENITEFPPACICIGLNDNANFINVSNTLHDDITANGGSSYLNEIPNVGHTVAFSTYPDEMMECLNFIEDQYPITKISTIKNKQTKITVFPNPANTYIEIIVGENHLPNQIAIMSTIDGKHLYKENIVDNKVDVSSLVNGLYLLMFKNEKGGIIQTTFSVQR